MHRALRRGLAAFVCLWFLMGLWLVIPPSGFAAEGTFVGRIVDAPPEEPLPKGWIFVQGRNHMLRRVEVAHAAIVYGGEVPASERRKCGIECLEPGLIVRVTADQDKAGEWRANRVEILHVATGRA